MAKKNYRAFSHASWEAIYFSFPTTFTVLTVTEDPNKFAV